MPSNAEPILTFRQFTKKDGLSSNFISYLFEDSEGVIWVGTNNGVSKLYGNHIESIFHNRNERVSIAGNYVVKIIEDSEGIIWIATKDKGLTRYDRKKPQQKAYTQFRQIPDDPHSLGCERLLNIVEWNPDYMLITAEWCAPMFLNRHDFTFSYVGTDMILNPAMAEPVRNETYYPWMPGIIDLNDSLVLITRVDQTEMAFIYNKHSGVLVDVIGNNSAVTILNTVSQNVEVNGTHYLIGWQKGIFRWDYGSDCVEFQPLYHQQEEFEDSEFYWMEALNDTTLLISDLKNGLGQIDLCTHEIHFFRNIETTEKLTEKERKYEIGNARLLHFMKDRKGCFWFASSKGVFFLDADVWKIPFYYFEKKLNPFHAIVYNNPDGGIFLLSDNQLHQLDINGTSKSTTVHIESKIEGPLHADHFFFNESPVILASNGLFYLESDTIKRFQDSLEHHPKTGPFFRFTASAIQIQEADTVLYAATHGNGLFKFQWINNAWIRQYIAEILVSTVHNSLQSSMVLLGDTFFIGSRSGLYQFDLQSEHLIHYKENPADPNSLFDNGIYDMHYSYGKLWLATRNGVGVYESGRFKKVGGINEYIRQLKGNKDGDIFVMTMNQVYRIDRETHESIKMSTPDFDMEHYPTFIELDEAGNLYVFYSHGYTVFANPSGSATEKQLKAIVYGLDINGTNADHTLYQSGIKLKSSENNLSFRLGTGCAAENNFAGYRYKTSDQSNVWQYAQSDNARVSFSMLPPGKYQLIIQAAFPGMEYGESYTLAFAILPPYWQTWWFITLVLITILTIAYYLVTYNLKQRIKVLEIRNQIARDLHDDIGSTISSIKIFSDLLFRKAGKQNSEDTQVITERIKNYAAGVEEKLADIIWTIKPGVKSIGDFVRQIERINHEIWEPLDIYYFIEAEETDHAIRLNDQARKHLLLIYREVLNNALKHSGCSHFSTKIYAEGNHFHIITAENGKGFNTQGVYAGNGIKNIRERVRILGGTFQNGRNEAGEFRYKFSFPFTNIRH